MVCGQDCCPVLLWCSLESVRTIVGVHILISCVRSLCIVGRQLTALVGLFRGVILPSSHTWCFVLCIYRLRVYNILPCNGNSHSTAKTLRSKQWNA